MEKINFEDVAAHYSPGTLLRSIEDGAKAMGKDLDDLTLADMAPVDEFHVGGQLASRTLLDQIGLGPDDRVADFGCGLGGTSRFIAETYGSRVDGIDLTAEFIEAGTAISRWLGLSDRVSLTHGNALNTGFGSGAYDAACMVHVGMNIPDKSELFAEVARVLKPGGQFALYDIVTNTNRALDYPVPWAAGPETCAAVSLDTYKQALEGAGFEISGTNDRTHFAGEFFAKMKAAAAKGGTPPPIGLQLVFGEQTREKVANMISNIADGRIAPTEIIARKV